MAFNGYSSPEICTRCGGACCKGLPGRCRPSDFGATRQEIEAALPAALETHYEEFDGEYVLPQRTLHGCVFLTPTGCTLPFASRPYECRMLEPREGDERCVRHADHYDYYVHAWRAFRELLRALRIMRREALRR